MNPTTDATTADDGRFNGCRDILVVRDRTVTRRSSPVGALRLRRHGRFASLSHRVTKPENHSATSRPTGRTRMAVPRGLNTPLARTNGIRLLTHSARPRWKAPLTGLYALESTLSVTIGRVPSREDAKAYFTPEETRNLQLRFAESSPFRAGGMSTSQPDVLLAGR